MIIIIRPRVIISGTNIGHNHHCTQYFVSYCKTSEYHDNVINIWTIGALSLLPIVHFQRVYHLLSLSIGRSLNRCKCTDIPIPCDTIDWVYTIVIIIKAQCGFHFRACIGIDPITYLYINYYSVGVDTEVFL